MQEHTRGRLPDSEICAGEHPVEMAAQPEQIQVSQETVGGEYAVAEDGDLIAGLSEALDGLENVWSDFLFATCSEGAPFDIPIPV
jgi:hypothetical protein